MSSPANSGHNAASRVLTMLDALARADQSGVSVRRLAADSGISRSAVHRVLAQLAELGYARLLPDDRYEAGSLALAWAALLGDYGLQDAAADALEELARAFDESAYAVEYQPQTADVVFVAVAHSTRPVRYRLELQTRAPLHAGSAGKAVLAYLPESISQTIPLDRWTPSTRTRRDDLARDLELTRQRGYAYSEGERIADAVGLGAPVFRDGQISGAIVLTIPRYRFDSSSREEYAAALVAAAASVSALLSPSSLGQPAGSAPPVA
jgi:DNA-binding IclR family transcriptional regulator